MVKLLSFVLLAMVQATWCLCASAEGNVRERRGIIDDTFAGTSDTDDAMPQLVSSTGGYVRRGLIDNIVSNLQQAATEAGQSVGNFTSGIQDQIEEFRVELTAEANKIRETIQQAITNATSNLSTVGTAVQECITKIQKSAEVILNEAVYNVTSCAEGRLTQVTTLVSELINTTNSAADAANEVRQKVTACANGTTNIFSIGSCLGSLLWQTEIKAATITGQSAMLVARINLSLAALPATLKICTATKIGQAALGVGQLAQTLAQCSLGAVVSSINQ